MLKLFYFGGQKVTKKCWDIHKLLSNVTIVTMLVLGKLRNTDVSLLFTGFLSFLMEKLISFLARFVTTVEKSKNPKLNNI